MNDELLYEIEIQHYFSCNKYFPYDKYYPNKEDKNMLFLYLNDEKRFLYLKRKIKKTEEDKYSLLMEEIVKDHLFKSSILKKNEIYEDINKEDYLNKYYKYLKQKTKKISKEIIIKEIIRYFEYKKEFPKLYESEYDNYHWIYLKELKTHNQYILDSFMNSKSKLLLLNNIKDNEMINKFKKELYYYDLNKNFVLEELKQFKEMNILIDKIEKSIKKTKDLQDWNDWYSIVNIIIGLMYFVLDSSLSLFWLYILIYILIDEFYLLFILMIPGLLMLLFFYLIFIIEREPYYDLFLYATKTKKIKKIKDKKKLVIKKEEKKQEKLQEKIDKIKKSIKNKNKKAKNEIKLMNNDLFEKKIKKIKKEIDIS